MVYASSPFCTILNDAPGAARSCEDAPGAAKSCEDTPGGGARCAKERGGACELADHLEEVCDKSGIFPKSVGADRDIIT
jgi:hypothetical protein